MGLSEAIEANLKKPADTLAPFAPIRPATLARPVSATPTGKPGAGAAWQTLLTNPTVRDKVNFLAGGQNPNADSLSTGGARPAAHLRAGGGALPLLNQGLQQFARPS